jgi:hypothetical protein
MYLQVQVPAVQQAPYVLPDSERRLFQAQHKLGDCGDLVCDQVDAKLAGIQMSARFAAGIPSDDVCQKLLNSVQVIIARESTGQELPPNSRPSLGHKTGIVFTTGAHYPELLHSELQGRAIHSQSCCRTVRTADNPP